MNVTAELKDWHFDPRNIFWGNIHGDQKQRWNDGTHIHTSWVEKVNKRQDCFIVTTRNSIYRLWFCDALGGWNDDYKRSLGKG